MTIKLNGIDKTAVLLFSLNTDIASRVLQALDDSEIKEISQAMTNLGKVDGQVVEAVILEFLHELTEALGVVGSVASTERFLKKVFSGEKVNTLLEEIRGPIGKTVWDKLAKLHPRFLASFLKNEYPQTVALILIQLPYPTAAKILSMLQSEFSFEVLKRILAMDNVERCVLENLEKTLRSEFISEPHRTQHYDNNLIVAEIFNGFDRSNEERFMRMLEEHDKSAASKVRKLMFTFNDLIKIDSVGMQTLLRVLDKSKVALALKGASPAVTDFFMQNMSQRAFKLLMEEVEALGQVRSKDIDDAQSYIIITAKSMIQQNTIKLLSSDDIDII